MDMAAPEGADEAAAALGVPALLPLISAAGCGGVLS